MAQRAETTVAECTSVHGLGGQLMPRTPIRRCQTHDMQTDFDVTTEQCVVSDRNLA